MSYRVPTSIPFFVDCLLRSIYIGIMLKLTERLRLASMSNSNDDTIDNILRGRMSRRRALSTGGKIGAAVVATAVVAGTIGYYAGSSNVPGARTVTSTIGGAGSTSTVTVTNTATQTVTAGNSSSSVASSAASSSTTSASASSTTSTATSNTVIGGATSVSIPGATPNGAYWPIVVAVQGVTSGISGTLNAYFPLQNEFQCDVTTPGTMAYACAQALADAYPNLTTTYYNPGSTGTPLVAAAQAGSIPWDFARYGNPYSWQALGYTESVQDYWNSWDQADRDAFDPNDIAAGTYNGELQMLPVNTAWETGWCRIDQLAAAGFGTVDPATFEYTGTTPTGMNYSEFLDMCTKVTQPSKEFYAFYPPIAPGNSVIQLSPDAMLQSNGVRLWLGDAGTCSITLDQAPNYNRALDTFQMYTNAIAMGVVTPGFQSITHAETLTAEKTGTICFQFGQDPGLWSGLNAVPITSPGPTTITGLTLGHAYNVMAPPSDNNYPIPWATKSSVLMELLKGSKNPAAAWEFMKLYLGQHAQYAQGISGSSAPSRTDLSGYFNELNAPLLTQWQSFGQPAQWAEVPLFSSYGGIIGTDFTNAFANYWQGTETAETAISNFASTVRSDLSNAGIGAYTATSTATATSGSYV
jgi:hypothetical protein